MANTKSAIKRMRQSERRRQHNRYFKGQARSFVRKARRAIAQEDLEAAREYVEKSVSALDKAAVKGIIHKNNAARRKSRLMKQLAALEEKSG